MLAKHLEIAMHHRFQGSGAAPPKVGTGSEFACLSLRARTRIAQWDCRRPGIRFRRGPGL